MYLNIYSQSSAAVELFEINAINLNFYNRLR